MNLTCPCCFAQISIEAALESAAGRELMGALATSGALARPLAAYLGCFRSQSRALAWDRALKLVREVQALEAEPRALAQALADTVESLRAKRASGDARPLKNHNYLKQVLVSVSVSVGAPHAAPAFDLQPNQAGTGEACLAPTRSQANQPAPRGKRAQGLAALQDWAHD